MRNPSPTFWLLLFIFVTSSAAVPTSGWLLDDVAVCTDPLTQQEAAIAPDGTGGTIVAWLDGRASDIYAQRYDASGRELWQSGGVDVSLMKQSGHGPVVVADGTGGAFIAFRNDSTTYCYKTISRAIIVKIGPDGELQWKKPLNPLIPASYDEWFSDQNPITLADGFGGAVVTWIAVHNLYIDYLCLDPPECCDWLEMDVYAQRFDAAGRYLWGPTPLLVCGDSREPKHLQAAVDSFGSLYCTWDDAKPYGNPDDIFAQKIDASGTLEWGPNGTSALLFPWYQATPVISADGEGGAIVAWRHDVSVSNNDLIVRAQRLDSLGTALWTLGGVPVSPASSEVTGLGVIGSGGDQWVFSWLSNASGILMPYSQRLDGSGNRLWQANGVSSSDGVHACADLRMASDGANGVVLAWDQLPLDDPNLSVRGIWGSSPTDVYAVGDGGLILRYAAGVWKAMESGVTANLFGVWGTSSSDVFAVGSEGTILHFDGSSWSPMMSPVTSELHGVWGSSADNVFAVGSQSTILRYDGLSWAIMSYGYGKSDVLYAVHGNAPDNAYAVGYAPYNSGRILKFDGTSWACVYCVVGQFYGVWVAPDSTVFISGHDHHYVGCLLRGRESSWDKTSISLPYPHEFRGVWGESSTNAFAVNDDGGIARYDGQNWTVYGASTDAPLDIWGWSGTDYWIVGRPLLIRHFRDGEWTTEKRTDGNLYMQHLDDGGQKLWTASGAPATVNVNAQAGPSLAYDPAGFALLAWRDNRNVSWDIYARKVSISRGPTVATELVAFQFEPAPGRVTVSWELSQCTADPAFIVSRSGDRDPTWRKITPSLARDALSFSFSDASVEPGGTYAYRVEIGGPEGSRLLFETGRIAVPAPALALHQNHPNPFNPTTTIRFDLPVRCRVVLRIYDAAGRLIKTLLEGERPPGSYRAEWNGTSSRGAPVSSGVYFCRLVAGKDSRTSKMVLLR